MKNNLHLLLQGRVTIFDPTTNEIFCDKLNAIHFENISEALAWSLGNKKQNYAVEMHFGNGGTSIDNSGVISYLPPNVGAASTDLYNPTFFKTVDEYDDNNADPLRNNMTVRHVPGTFYSDLLVTCLLDYGEPAGQYAFDNVTQLQSPFVFDEIGIKAWSSAGPGTGKLLTHVIFHPIQKSLNRLIQIDYTIRVQTLTNITG